MDYLESGEAEKVKNLSFCYECRNHENFFEDGKVFETLCRTFIGAHLSNSMKMSGKLK